MLDKCQNGQYFWTGESFSPEVILEVISTLEDLPIMHMGTSTALYEYLSEGMLNILHHAYDSDELVKWEIQLTVQSKAIYLSIRDYGKSIPVSFLEYLRAQNVRGLNDSSLIHCALHKQNTLNGRGLGLSSILSYVDKNIFNSFRIKSRNGIFNYAQNNLSMQEREITHKGTLLEISVDRAEVAE